MATQTKNERVLATGTDVIVRAALDAGAEMFCGYPITPITEILSGWAEEAAKNDKLIFQQTEDESSAGFMTLGGVLSGRRSFTATGGPGNVIMQDPLSMAEAMRLPIVVYIGQRGGPSTGTVIFSQQELNLTRFGGNGEGMRIVYSPSTLQEMYDYMIKAFDVAWRYKFPTFVLGDGYLGKTLGEVKLRVPKKTFPTHPYVLYGRGASVNLRNTYSMEEDLYEVLQKHFKDYAAMSKEVIESESYLLSDADIVVFAHGVVGHAAKRAVLELREEGVRAGLFRPITMRPFPSDSAKKAVRRAKKILIAEASQGQFGRIVREVLYGTTDIPVHRLYRPAMGITTEDIVKKVIGINK